MSFNSRAEVAQMTGEKPRVERSFEHNEQVVALVEKVKDLSVSFPDAKPKGKSTRPERKATTNQKGKEKVKLNKTAALAVTAFVTGILALISFTVPFAQTMVWGWLTPAAVQYLTTFFKVFGGMAAASVAVMWGTDFFSDRQREKRYKKELAKKGKKK